MVKRSVAILFLILTFSCRHTPLEPVNCVDIPPATNGWGYTVIQEQYLYRAPSFNPASEDSILYVRWDNKSQSNQLWVMNLVTRSKKILTSDIFYWPKWSAKGYIGYIGVDKNMRTLRLRDSQSTILTTDHYTFDFDWSPDGSCIVFDDLGIQVMSAVGSNRRRLFEETDYVYPSWSPNGKWIAFAKHEVGHNAFLVLFDTASKTFTKLGMANSMGTNGIEWFPDSQRLLWTTRDGIYLTDIYGNLKLVKKGCSSREYSCPTISPDGSLIIVERTDKEILAQDTMSLKTNLYIMNADGSDERKVEF